jgi:hypothetical protein
LSAWRGSATLKALNKNYFFYIHSRKELLIAISDYSSTRSWSDEFLGANLAVLSCISQASRQIEYER